MFLCYLGESGTSEVPGTTASYVLAGLAIPMEHWKECDIGIEKIRRKYGLEHSEIQPAWVLRSCLEQSRVPDFKSLNYFDRRQAVEQLRKAELARLQELARTNPKAYQQTKKNHRLTAPYIHLACDERAALLWEIAECIASWKFARLFAACINKASHPVANDPRFFSMQREVDEQAFEQVAACFEAYLSKASAAEKRNHCGLFVHDHNDTETKKRMELMQKFHHRGTTWTNLAHVVETPLFVNRQLTGLVQAADLCGYALRRYLENDEEELFDIVFQRADRRDGNVTGVRHFTGRGCECKICLAQNARPAGSPPVAAAASGWSI